MNRDNNILGCTVIGQSVLYNDSQELKDSASKNGKIFRSYVYGNNGIYSIIDKLNYQNYGKDLELILFQFYINPIPYLLSSIEEIEKYRKKEKSIGIPIVVTDDNFFNISEENRYIFLIKEILDKIDVLEKVVKKKKLDTNVELLKSNIKELKLFPTNL